jgi:hypothetical protein
MIAATLRMRSAIGRNRSVVRATCAVSVLLGVCGTPGFARSQPSPPPRFAAERGYGFQYDFENRLTKVFVDADRDARAHAKLAPPFRIFMLEFDRLALAIERVIVADADDDGIQPQALGVVKHVVRQRNDDAVLKLELVVVHLAGMRERYDELDRSTSPIDEGIAVLGDEEGQLEFTGRRPAVFDLDVVADFEQPLAVRSP